MDAKCKSEKENNEKLSEQSKVLDEQVKSLTKQLSDALDQIEALTSQSLQPGKWRLIWRQMNQY